MEKSKTSDSGAVIDMLYEVMERIVNLRKRPSRKINEHDVFCDGVMAAFSAINALSPTPRPTDAANRTDGAPGGMVEGK